MNMLGTGLSVQTLIERVGITYEQLCELAQEYPDLHKELKRWYKRYDFSTQGDKIIKEAKAIQDALSFESFKAETEKIIKLCEKQDKPLETKKKTVKRAKKQSDEVVGG